MKKALIAIFALGLSVAYAASSYNVTLYKSTTVNGTQLKPGDYKLEIQGNKAVFKQGRTTAESTVRVENATQKFLSTSVGYEGESANNQIQEIRIGGTSLKLLFDQDGKAASAAAGR
jgi:hypothetical protein